MQEKRAIPPAECPVCGNTILQVSPRQSVCSLTENDPVSGILSYRCANGHVFLPQTEGK